MKGNSMKGKNMKRENLKKGMLRAAVVMALLGSAAVPTVTQAAHVFYDTAFDWTDASNFDKVIDWSNGEYLLNMEVQAGFYAKNPAPGEKYFAHYTNIDYRINERLFSTSPEWVGNVSIFPTQLSRIIIDEISHDEVRLYNKQEHFININREYRDFHDPHNCHLLYGPMSINSTNENEKFSPLGNRLRPYFLV